ncbi:hypothetical protein D9615_004830 [Tricholomella constricta]|uniref:Uncharacterized protein n=1 Tax=Tricholomella constricta TaxID=117010 RepID=A0A8H5M737_9AGAR|nr:hypothetical protein D9615_004830 [Tricholomella constricta]
MVSNKFRHLPIRSEDGSIVGLLDITKVFHEVVSNAHRKSSASEQLIHAMAGVKAELGAAGSNSDMLAWAAKLREKTALPDLASILGSHTEPATVGPKTSLREVAQLMKEKGTTAVCVIEDAASPGALRRNPRIVGIFTTKDIVLRVIAFGLDPPRCSVVRVMTPHPDTGHPTTSIHDAVKKMYNGHYLNIPVLEDDGRLLAIIDVLTLAEASQEQIKEANQDLSVPGAATGPMWDNFFDSIGNESPVSPDSGTPYPLISMDEPIRLQQPPQLEVASVVENGSTTASEGDALSPKGIASPSIPVSPSANNRLYVFKFRAPNGMAHRFQSRHDDSKQLRETVAAKLATDPFFDSKFYADPARRPEPSDFLISYTDADGDTVVIASDDDVMDAVSVARTAGADRVVLAVQGGRSWATTSVGAGVNEGAVKPAPAAVPFVNEEKLHLARVPTFFAEKVNIDHEQDAPPEYTPNDEREAAPSTFSQSPTMLNSPGATSESEENPVQILQESLLLHHIVQEPNETTPPVNLELSTVTDDGVLEEHHKSDGDCATEDQPSEDDASPDAENLRALVTRLTAVFESVDQYKQLLACQCSNAQQVLDMFQTLLDTPGLSAKLVSNVLPSTRHRTGGDDPVAAGSFADIYKGRFVGQAVCLKVIRLYQTSEVHLFLKQFSAEAILWGQLSHINLLPIYGLYRYNGRLCLVAPWMENGDISHFLEKNPDVNRAQLVLDVASGISYLHGNDIIHGDLKGANILVNGAKRACLADFGLAAVSDANILHWTSYSSAASRGGSVPWQAPELFAVDSDEIVHNTKPSDVYAFSCVAYEIFTGNIPFVELGRDTAVMLKVRSGIQPSRPAPSSPSWGPWGLTETTWMLMQKCWSTDPEERPNIHDIVLQHGSTILVDDWPSDSDDIISPAYFRHSVGRTDLPSVLDVDVILSNVSSEADAPALTSS